MRISLKPFIPSDECSIRVLLFALLLTGCGQVVSESSPLAFGSNGVMEGPFGGGDEILGGFDVQRRGYVVVAGRSSRSGSGIAVYTSAGFPDLRFGVNGYFHAQVGIANATFSAIRVLRDDSFIAASYFQSGDHYLMLVKFNANRVLDESFGENGYALVPFSGPGGEVRDLLQLADEKILVAGTSYLARFNTDGSLDGSFGQAGIQALAVPRQMTIKRVFARGDNRPTVVAGGEYGGGVLIHLLDDGSPDPTFGTHGIVSIEGAWRFSQYAGAAQDTAGDFFLACDSGVIKVKPDGRMDQGFGDHGFATVIPENHAFYGLSHDVAIDLDGNILNAFDLLAVAKFDPTGQAVSGFVMPPLGPGLDRHARSLLAVQADGKFLHAAQVADPYFSVSRHLQNGEWDDR